MKKNNQANSKNNTVQISLLARIRAYFFAGILVIAPISITLYLAWILINFVDSTVSKVLPAKYNPETYLPFSVPGLGLVIAFILITLVGAFTAGYLGKFFVKLGETIVNKMPFIRNIYGAVKQIFETIFTGQSNAFRKVVLFEYPRKGTWAMGFITGTTKGEVQNITKDEVINVFLPTTPNPTSGYLLFVPKQDLIPLAMTIEEGIKMIVSGGIITPELANSKKSSKKKITKKTS